MAKVGIEHFTVYSSGSSRNTINVSADVMFSKKDGFYIVVGRQFVPFCEGQGQESRNELGIHIIRTGGSYHGASDGVATYRVSGSTYENTLDLYKRLCRQSLDSMIEKSNVILVFYGSEKEQNNRPRETYFPKIGIEISFCYCQKKTVNGQNPNYYELVKDHWNPEKMNENSVSFPWHMKPIELPDTPENRAWLEDLYKKLETLIGKMGEIMATPEDLQARIEKTRNFNLLPANLLPDGTE